MLLTFVACRVPDRLWWRGSSLLWLEGTSLNTGVWHSAQFCPKLQLSDHLVHCAPSRIQPEILKQWLLCNIEEKKQALKMLRFVKLGKSLPDFMNHPRAQCSKFGAAEFVPYQISVFPQWQQPWLLWIEMYSKDDVVNQLVMRSVTAQVHPGLIRTTRSGFEHRCCEFSILKTKGTFKIVESQLFFKLENCMIWPK